MTTRDDLIEEAYKLFCDDEEDIYTSAVQEVLEDMDIQDEVEKCVKERIDEFMIHKWIGEAVNATCDTPNNLMRYLEEQIKGTTHDIVLPNNQITDNEVIEILSEWFSLIEKALDSSNTSWTQQEVKGLVLAIKTDLYATIRKLFLQRDYR
jgi:hypothetical protein